jgi:ArsR family transcriptional regulator
MSGWRDYIELRAELRALSSATSLNIVHQLAQRNETNVTDLAAALALSQPLVSWHLRNLHLVGLVSTRRQGREVFCSLDRIRFEASQRTLQSVILPDESHAADAEAATGDPTTGEHQLGPPRVRAGPSSG